MNVYKYVQSKSIKDYWQDIDYVPDQLGTAYLINYYSKPDITLKEKWADYKELADSGNITYIPPMEWYDFNCPLEDFLKILIKTETGEYVGRA